jgi:hypothetical protein
MQQDIPPSGESIMNPSALSQIEAHIAQLSFTEQLWLLERVAQRLRTQGAPQSVCDHQLAAMADDQEVQQELRSIEEEFAHAAADGLDTP